MDVEAPSASSQPRGRASSALLTFGPPAACIAALIGHAYSFIPYFPDDSFISLRYAKRLTQGLGLTWTDGERVEGYTNFLWVLVVAAGGWLSGDFVAAARALGVAALASVIVALFFAHRVRRPADALAPGFGGLAIALAGPVAAYSIAGLEHPLSVALLAWAIVLIDRALNAERDAERPAARALWLPSLLLGLCSITRADALVLVSGVLLGVVAGRGLNHAGLATALRLAVMPIALYTAVLLFRRVYYGAWVPNTYHAKVALTDVRLLQGLAYVGGAGLPLMALLIALAGALAAAAGDRDFRRRLFLPLAPLAVWCSYLVFIGGDNMPQRRHMVPAIALLALIGALAAKQAISRGARVRVAAYWAAPALLGLLFASSLLDPQANKARGSRWNWTGEPVGLFLKGAFSASRPLLAVDAAGALPFYAELPALDMLGLNDRYLATHRPADFGRGKLAHELGDGRYVLRRKPDLIAFGNPLGGPRPVWRGGREMVAEPEFQRMYRLITFETPPPQSVRPQLWVRVEDSAVGVKRGDDQKIEIPGFLLAGERGVARLDAEGRLGATVTPEQPGIFGIELPPGRWSARADVDGEVKVTFSGPRGAPSEARNEAENPGPPASFTVRVEATSPVHVRGISLVKQ